MSRADPAMFVADFDSASGMLRALANHLHGRPFARLGMPRALHPLVVAVDALPERLKTTVYAWSGWAEAVRPKRLSELRAEDVATWMVDHYPRRRYPAVAVGSSNGALTHLWAALGIPWLPQTWLIPVRRTLADPDAPRQSLEEARPWARALLDANPELQLHHMHDANQDRLMIRHMTYFRVKRRTLGRVYERFLGDVLAPGGTILVVECGQGWPTTRVGPRHVFQHGGFGGAAPEEYLHGGPRVARFLASYGAKVRRWNSPEPDGESPEAEWGFAPALLEDVRRFARERGLRVVRLRFQGPQEPSPFVADLHRWWYRRHGVAEAGLVVSSFVLMDPFTTLGGRGVPFWAVFGTEPAARALEDYLAKTPSFDRLGLMLFAHGIRSVGFAPIERWRAILGRARREGRFLGVNEAAYPGDFATFARYETALEAFLPRRPPLPPLTLGELVAYVGEHGGGGVTWEGLGAEARRPGQPVPPALRPAAAPG
jgi:hypothetical protein